MNKSPNSGNLQIFAHQSIPVWSIFTPVFWKNSFSTSKSSSLVDDSSNNKTSPKKFRFSSPKNKRSKTDDSKVFNGDLFHFSNNRSKVSSDQSKSSSQNQSKSCSSQISKDYNTTSNFSFECHEFEVIHEIEKPTEYYIGLPLACSTPKRSEMKKKPKSKIWRPW